MVDQGCTVIATDHQARRIALTAIGPSLLLSVVYVAFLGHRLDYVGHYAAGYGGTLVALTLLLATIPERGFVHRARLAVLVGCVVCVLLGALLEATVFRFAKFDEIDFCNQSLGAVLAGLAALAGIRVPQTEALKLALVTGLAFLVVGFIFAFS